MAYLRCGRTWVWGWRRATGGRSRVPEPPASAAPRRGAAPSSHPRRATSSSAPRCRAAVTGGAAAWCGTSRPSSWRKALYLRPAPKSKGEPIQSTFSFWLFCYLKDLYTYLQNSRYIITIISFFFFLFLSFSFFLLIFLQLSYIYIYIYTWFGGYFELNECGGLTPFYITFLISYETRGLCSLAVTGLNCRV